MPSMSLDIQKSLRAACIFVLGAVCLVIGRYVYDHFLRPRWYLRNLPGPARDEFFLGNLKVLRKLAPGSVDELWHGRYGPVLKYDGYLSSPWISTTDKRALHHILVSEPSKFPKPNYYRRLLEGFMDNGLIVAEGADHTRQRKIINPSFGPAHIKAIYSLFLDKAIEFSDVLAKLMADSPVQPTPVDMLQHASRVALDIIGTAGFNYDFDAIKMGNSNELVATFNDVFAHHQKVSYWQILVTLFPVLGYLPIWTERLTAMNRIRSALNRIGTELLSEKKFALSAGHSAESPLSLGRDLLSVLIKANVAAGLKPSQKMTDKEVIAQVATLLFSGHETTANTLSWAVFGMCKEPETQQRLRAEINELGTHSPSYAELNSLPYLDAVVRETLRLYTPFVGTTRISSEDSFIPLSQPIVDAHGVKRSEIFVPKNTSIYIPIVCMNTNQEAWGEDSHEFRPERWLSGGAVPDGVKELPSLAFPTFLAGARGCIGFRFTMVEMKIILYSLVRVAEFKLAVPVEDVMPRTFVVTRPTVKGRQDEGWQLPVLISPVNNDN